MGSDERNRIRHKMRWLLAAGALALAAAAPAAAHAYSAAPGYTAGDYATGFLAGSNGWGPIGIAFDQSDTLYVADAVDGNLYRFPVGGGQASPATLVGNIPGGAEGLAIGRDGSLYAARYYNGDVVQIDLATGKPVRTVATGIPCATGLAVDPTSGDLFVSQNQCGATIFRISGYRAGAGTVRPFATVSGVDGLVFNSDGTLFADGDGTIYRITANQGSATSTPIANVPGADGMALGDQPSDPGSRFLVTNRIDGFVTRVDFGTSQPATKTNILTGGSRGDFVATDSHGCLYATQTDRVVRIAPASGGCQLLPSTPGIRAQVSSQRALQCTRRPLVLIDVVRHGGHVYLLGAADRRLVGRRVQIVYTRTGRTVASAVIGADGFFRATAPLPPPAIRATNSARYEAMLGGEHSLALKLARRMVVRSITAARRVVTIRGHVIAPLAKPIVPIAVERRVTCGRYVIVKWVLPSANGEFTARLPAPSGEQAAVYRAETLVRRSFRSAKRFRTFTMPRVVALG